MANEAFLLRYQETCQGEDTPGTRCSTKSETFVAAEQGDKDASIYSATALPPARSLEGTMTKTGVPRETATDESAEKYEKVLPRAGTFTKVKKEQADRSPYESDSRTIPIASQNSPLHN